MIATFLIETGLLLYGVWRYKLSETTRIVAMIFAALAAFQLAEFAVCRSLGDPLVWSRAGYVAIALLPPLGMHLIYAVAGAKRRMLLLPAYASAALFVGFFAFVGHSLEGHACLGNYVIFQVARGSGALFAGYYYGWLVAGILLARHFANHTANVRMRRALTGVATGYVAFIVPTIAANLINPETIAAIPSIMCGFAVLLALILGFWVLPNAAKRRV